MTNEDETRIMKGLNHEYLTCQSCGYQGTGVHRRYITKNPQHDLFNVLVPQCDDREWCSRRWNVQHDLSMDFNLEHTVRSRE